MEVFRTRKVPAERTTADILLKNHKEFIDAAGLIILPEKKHLAKSHDWKNDNAAFLRRALMLAAKTAPVLKESAAQGGALFATISFLDGSFGFSGKGMSNPMMGGLAGLAKTAALEWEGVTCRAIDLPPDWNQYGKMASLIVDELLNSGIGGPGEIGLTPDTRYELNCLTEIISQSKTIGISEKDVVIISGGARGVTAASATALAVKYRPTLILLGRSPEPFGEPSWLKGLTLESEIKKAILENEFAGRKVSPVMVGQKYKTYMANREIKENLDAITRAGAKVAYFSVDIRDTDGVAQVLNRINSAYGPVSVLIHGAGVLEDRLISDKTEDQFNSVFETKVKGLYNLLTSPHARQLQYLILFSSVAARTGNIGQVDYAMANEALNKIAQQERLNRPECRVISINWGPWDGGMVTPGLKKEFLKNNIQLIPLETGTQSLIAEMENPSSRQVEVVIGNSLLNLQGFHKEVSETFPRQPTKQPSFSIAFERDIHIDEYPVLKSHILDGTPVVPFAMMMEWFGHAALHENPGLVLLGFEDMRVLNGIKIDGNGRKIRLLAGKIARYDGSYCLDIEIRSDGFNGREIVHSKAKAILGEKTDAVPSFKAPTFMGSNGYHRSISAIYDDVLFHGIDLQGIREVNTLTSNGMVAKISPAPSPDKWIKHPLRNRWVGDPLVLDAAFQMASLWCYEKLGNVSLPVYGADYRQFRPRFPEEPITTVLEITGKSAHKMNGDFTFLDAKNEIIARLTGFEAILDESLMKAFKPAYAEKRKAS